jgi:hypothetical protein
MITFEQAKQIAIKKIGSNRVLLEDMIIEKPYGWFFSYSSKTDVESGNLKHILVGSKGFIVEREDGCIFDFGSAYSLEHDFAAYEAGFK